VVVGVQAGRAQPLGLLGRQHAEGDAGLEPLGLHLGHHLQDLLERWAVFDLAPGRPHAEPGGAHFAGAPGRGEHLVHAQQLLAIDRGLVVGRLRAISAVFRAAAGLHAEQRAQLQLALGMMLEVDRAGPVDQLEQRQVVDRADLGASVVVAETVGHRSRP